MLCPSIWGREVSYWVKFRQGFFNNRSRWHRQATWHMIKTWLVPKTGKWHALLVTAHTVNATLPSGSIMRVSLVLKPVFSDFSSSVWTLLSVGVQPTFTDEGHLTPQVLTVDSLCHEILRLLLSGRPCPPPGPPPHCNQLHCPTVGTEVETKALI